MNKITLEGQHFPNNCMNFVKTKLNTVSNPYTSICSFVWIVLKMYSIAPSQDQYGAQKITQ